MDLCWSPELQGTRLTMEGTALAHVRILLFLTLDENRVQVGELLLTLPLGAQGTPTKKEGLQVLGHQEKHCPQNLQRRAHGDSGRLKQQSQSPYVSVLDPPHLSCDCTAWWFCGTPNSGHPESFAYSWDPF